MGLLDFNNPIFLSKGIIMEQFIQFMTNPYIIGLSIYFIMLLIQTLITIITMRKNINFLLVVHDYTKKELRMLFIMSILLTPISTLLWLQTILFKKSEIEK